MKFRSQHFLEQSLNLEGENTATLSIHIPDDLWCFEGHFDNEPALPAVYQLSEIVLSIAQRLWPELQHLRRVHRLKFRRLIRPGETLELHLQRQTLRVDFTMLLANEIASRGTLLFENV